MNRRAKYMLLSLPVVASFLFAACGASPEDNSSGASITGQDEGLSTRNPCEMLTQAEIEGIFDEPSEADDEPTSHGPIRGCSFKTTGSMKFFLIQIGPATVLEVDSGDPAVTSISDLGDEATFSDHGLRVRVGETVLQVTTWHSRSKQDEALTMTQEVARLALDE